MFVFFTKTISSLLRFVVVVVVIVCACVFAFWNRYLTTSEKNKFTQQNCPNCPIVGQMEVTGGGSAGAISTWKADQGVYLGAS